MKRTSSNFHYLSWPVQNVVAFTTTVHHPDNLKSLSSFGSFNLGLHVGDDEGIVNANRQLLLNYIPNNSSIQWLDQVHGNHVEIIQSGSHSIVADAVITQQKNTALAIMTADCLPIVISSGKGDEVAAIHAGWKPLSKKIIEHTISKMKTPIQDLYVWLGPCIGPEKFEVGADVYQQFVSIDEGFNKAFVETNPQEEERKFLANLHAIAQKQFVDLGIKHIYSLPHCTYTQSQDYYSYRRNNKTGRMATIICRK